MSVYISFEQDGGSGLVAAGASVWDAARRLGIGFRAECRGRGECEGCAVQISSGADSLSSATEAELKILGAERLLAGERLACQSVLINNGEVTARVVPPSANQQEKPGAKTLPFKQQIGTFIETEANAISGAVNMIRGKSNALVEKFLNLSENEKSKPTGANGTNPS